MNSLFTISDQVQSPFHSDHFHSLLPLLLIKKKEFEQTHFTKLVEQKTKMK